MLEKYYEVFNHYITQLKLSNDMGSVDILFKKLKKAEPQLDEGGLMRMYQMNVGSIHQQLEELKSTKIFHIDEDLGLALELTDNKVMNRHLPFDNMFFEYDFKLDNINILAFNIFKDKWGTLIRCFYKDKKDIIMRQEVSFFDKFFELNEHERKLMEAQKLILRKTKEYEFLNDKQQKKIRIFFCNFIDFLNTPDVKIVTVDRTKEQNAKRISRGKLPIPTQKFIRVTGELKVYLNKLNSGKHIEYSHRFWVRGHFRTLRDDKWKNKQGTKIWIKPFIKGKGILVEKIYEAKKIGVEG